MRKTLYSDHLPADALEEEARRTPLADSSFQKQKLLHAVQSLAEPDFWTPKWTPGPAKRPKCIHRYDLQLALRQTIEARTLRRKLAIQRKAIQKTWHPGTWRHFVARRAVQRDPRANRQVQQRELERDREEREL